jgi:hypothetical protein
MMLIKRRKLVTTGGKGTARARTPVQTGKRKELSKQN